MTLNIHKQVISTFTFLSLFMTGCTIDPVAFKKDEILKASQEDYLLLKAKETIKEPLTLEDALSRGIKFNRDKRVKIMEASLEQNQLDLFKYNLLPELAANAGYSIRDNFAASSNAIFENGEPQTSNATTYSVSQEKRQVNADITFSWNILDFGLSYVRAEQQSDRYLIAKEQIRKVTHNITQEIRRAYYQAVTSEELLQRIRPLMIEVRQALRDSDKVKSLRLKSPMEALTYERELLDVLRDLSILQKTLISAKIELAELIGLKPNVTFELTEKVQSSYLIPEISFKLPTMEKIALENRPEILESRYKERISKKELTVAKLKMLPSVNIDTGYNYNSNEYLLNNTWNSVGANVSWNLFSLFKYSAMNTTAEAQIALAKERKLALSLAVITQVHLSVIRYRQAVNQYKLSKEYLAVSEDIYIQATNSNSLNMNSKLVMIKEKLSYLLATLRHSSAHANMQNSYGRIYASLGILNDSEVSYKKDMPSMQEVEKLAIEKFQEKERLKKLQLIEEANEIVRVENLEKEQHLEALQRMKELQSFIKIKRVEEEKKKVQEHNNIKNDALLMKIKEQKAIEKELQNKRNAELKHLEETNKIYRTKQHKEEIDKISTISSLSGVTEKLQELKKDLQRLKLKKMKEDLRILKEQQKIVSHVKPSIPKALPTLVPLQKGNTLMIGKKTHTVKEGEKLWQISKDYNYKLSAILKDNPWLRK